LTTLHAFAALVRRRTLELLINSQGALDYDEAERIAAREVAAIERRKPKAMPSLRSDNAEPNSAKAKLLATLNAIASRMGSVAASIPETLRERSVSTTPKREPKVAPPTSEEQPASDVLLLYSANTGTASGSLIPDEEYPRRYHDIPTQNWRRSIGTSLERVLLSQFVLTAISRLGHATCRILGEKFGKFDPTSPERVISPKRFAAAPIRTCWPAKVNGWGLLHVGPHALSFHLASLRRGIFFCGTNPSLGIVPLRSATPQL
jgi:hypothetical protein